MKPYLREDAIIIPERFEMMLTETKTGKSYTQYLSSYKGISGLDLQDLS
ncbi:MAG: hypothetical protein H6767_04085 [Candidatus Peribacteria bacterium]|nr:MAG: hypothetical protein H6767_04085 [Candidatus Peribacteria bacterium]